MVRRYLPASTVPKRKFHPPKKQKTMLDSRSTFYDPGVKIFRSTDIQRSAPRSRNLISTFVALILNVLARSKFYLRTAYAVSPRKLVFTSPAALGKTLPRPLRLPKVKISRTKQAKKATQTPFPSPTPRTYGSSFPSPLFIMSLRLKAAIICNSVGKINQSQTGRSKSVRHGNMVARALAP
jgi:hypothetical protein